MHSGGGNSGEGGGDDRVVLYMFMVEAVVRGGMGTVGGTAHGVRGMKLGKERNLLRGEEWRGTGGARG